MHHVNLNGQWALRLGIFLAQNLPQSMGIWLAARVAKYVSSQKKHPHVISARANQWVVSNYELSTIELTKRVDLVFYETSRCLYDLFSSLKKPQTIIEKVDISPEANEAFKRLEQQKPTIFVAPHLSNFDMIGQSLALTNHRFQVLSYPKPEKGYQYQNQLRKKVGLNITPMSLKALREAKETLRSGGSVLTGLDRPVANSKYTPLFFNRPAHLSVSYIKLALDEKVPVCVVAGRTLENGKYRLLASEILTMKPEKTLISEMLENAERVLRIAESFIRQTPEQWSMFYPVWPEVIPTTP